MITVDGLDDAVSVDDHYPYVSVVENYEPRDSIHNSYPQYRGGFHYQSTYPYSNAGTLGLRSPYERRGEKNMTWDQPHQPEQDPQASPRCHGDRPSTHPS